jgi:hypothetical protein
MSDRSSRCYDAVSGFSALKGGHGFDLAGALGAGAQSGAVPEQFVQNQAGTIRLSYILLRAGVFAGGLGLAVAAHALSLGELEIRSGLGQAFYATVRYTTPRGDEVHPLCIKTRYVQGPPTSGVPELPDPRIDVQPEQGGGTIIIRTARPVDEPLMRLYLSINCGPSVSFNREFMVALDPPRGDALMQRNPVTAPALPGTEAPRPSGGPVRRPAPEAPAAPGGGAATGAPSAEAAAQREEQREEQRRLRRAREGAVAGAAPRPGSQALPYEPGVTPPPGKRGGRATPPAAAGQPQYRLTLSRPGADEPDPRPVLRSSDSLESLNRANLPAVSDAQREKLRVESRVRMSDDPVALTLQMQERLVGLESGFADVRKELAGIRGERESAAKRIAQLEQEKRELSAWLNGMALALGFIGCVAVAALLFWTYRRRAERADARKRLLAPEGAPLEPVEPTLEEQFDPTPWHPEEGTPAPAPVATPVSMPPVAAPAPTPPVAAPRVPTPVATPPGAAPRAVTPPVRPPAVTAPKVTAPAVSPPPALPVQPAQEAVSSASSDDTYTATVEIEPKAPKGPPPVEDFYAHPPRGADEPEFSLEDPADAADTVPLPIASMPPPAPTELPPISFDLPAPGGAGATLTAPDPVPLAQHGEAIEFSLDGATTPKFPEVAPAAPAQPEAAAAPAGQIDDPFGSDPAPPPPPGLAATLLPPVPSREPAPTIGRMQAIVDEIAAAHLAEPAMIAPVPGVSTGVHRTLDIDLGGDGDTEMRAQLYRQEFELKLFPEIVHGQAKLKVPQSIISLARTYYQEDFDTNRAVNLLEYAADRTPDPQRVRLALLEILRMEGMAREYTAVSRTFHEQFPGAQEWETVSAYGKLLMPSEPLFKDADVTGYDLNMPSMWLGSTLDMTRYVLAQDLHDAMHGGAEGEGA